MKSKTLKKLMAISLATLMALSAVGCANEKDMGKKLAYINIIDYIEKLKKIWGCM